MYIVFAFICVGAFCVWLYCSMREEEEKQESIFQSALKNAGISYFTPALNWENFKLDVNQGLVYCEVEINVKKSGFIFSVHQILNYSLNRQFETQSDATFRTLEGGFWLGTAGAIAGAANAKETEYDTGKCILDITFPNPVGTIRWQGVSKEQGRYIIEYFDWFKQTQ